MSRNGFPGDKDPDRDADAQFESYIDNGDLIVDEVEIIGGWIAASFEDTVEVQQ